MIIYSLTSLVACLISLSSGTFIYFKAPRNPMNQTFAILCIILSYWGFTEFAMRQAQSAAAAQGWIYMSSVWPLALAVLLHFALIFVGGGKQVTNRLPLGLIYVTSVLIVALGPLDSTYISHPLRTYWGWTYSINESLLYDVTNIWAVGISLFCAYLLIRHWFKTRNPIDKRRNFYLVIGISLPVIAGFFEVVWPYLGTRIPELSATGFALGTLPIAYSVSKYRLFSLPPEMLTEKVLATINDLFIVVGPDLIIRDVNQATIRALGYSKNELIGQNWTIVLAKEAGNTVDICGKVSRDTDFSDLVTRFKTKAEEGIDVSLSCSFIESNGITQVIFLLARDITERKRSENELRQAHQLLEAVFENTHVMIAYLDPNFNFVRVNRAFAHDDGHESDFFPDKNYFDLFPCCAECRANFQQVAETGEPYLANSMACEFGSHLERRIRYFDWSLVAVTSMDGTVRGLILVLQDVTEHRKAEENLLQSEGKLRLMLESISDGITVSDLAGNIVQVNQAKVRMLGYKSKDEIVGLKVFDLIAKRDLKRATVDMNKILKEGIIPSIEYNLLAKDGREIPTEMGATLLRDSSGKPFGIIGITKDITERKHTEQKLADEATRRRILIEQSRDGIVILDQNGGVYESNQRFADMLGYSLEEVYRLCVWDWDFSIPREQIVLMIRGVDEQGAHFQTKHRRKDGSIYDVEISTNGAMFAGQKLIFCVCRDITKRKQAEEELEDSRQQLRNLAAHLQSAREEENKRISRTIHDELVQLLTALTMDLSWITKIIPGQQESLIEAVTPMIAIVDKAVEIVEGIALELRPVLLDDLGLIAAIEWQLNRFTKSSGIQCNVILIPKRMTVSRGYSTVVFRILQEALTNIYHHAKATQVTISLIKKKNSLIFKVSDNGRGITPEEISSTTSLGLVGIRERVLAVGGEVIITGVNNFGTTIEVTIPMRPSKNHD